MGNPRENRTRYKSVCLLLEEIEHWEELARDEGKSRNRYIRDLLKAQKTKRQKTAK